MTQEYIQILLDANTDKVTRLNNQIKQLSSEMRNVSKSSDVYKKKADELDKVAQNLTKTRIRTNDLRVEATKMGQAWNASKNSILGFNGALLSGLFFGMQLERTMKRALGAMFESYKKIIPEQHAFNIMTTRLAANWEFFKFQLADALGKSPLFIKLTESAISFLNVLSNMNESTLKFIGYSLGFLLVAGFIYKMIGILGMGVASIIEVGAGIKAFGAALGGITPIGTLVTAAALAGLYLAYKALATFINETESGQKWFDGFKNSLSTLGESMGKLVREILSIFNIELENTGEMLVFIGGLIANVVSAFTGFAHILVGVARIIASLIKDVFRPFANIIKSTVRALMSLFSGDWAGAWDAIRSADFSLSLDTSKMREIYDDTIKGVGQLEIVNPMDAVREYRAAQDDRNRLSNVSTPAQQNINILSMEEAVSSGVINQNEVQAFFDALGKTSFTSGGFN